MSNVADLDLAVTTADILPSATAALRGRDNPLGLTRTSAVVVLLIDGLGWNLLQRHLDHGPVLAGLAGDALHSGFPTTTASGLSSLATGRRSGIHGITGYTSPWGEADGINWLTWSSCSSGTDLRDTAPPEEIQPLPTVFELARADGLHPAVVSSRSFVGSGLTRAIFRGGEYVPTISAADTVAGILGAVRPGALVYGYFNELDGVGHLQGTRSVSWQLQLQVLDRAIELLLDRLPRGTTVLVTGDHGMVDVPEHAKVDLDADPRLTEDVLAITGESRNRHLTVRPDRVAYVAHRWQDSLGDGFHVRTRDEAVASGLFGPEVTATTRRRIGDLMVTATGEGALVRRTASPGEAGLIGCHGAATDDEILVPLLRHQT